MSNIANAKADIKDALNDTTGAGSGKLHFKSETSDFYLYRFYGYLEADADDSFDVTLIDTAGLVMDTLKSPVGISEDSGHMNIISTIYTLTAMPTGTTDPLNTDSIAALPDSAKLKLLITAMVDLSLAHNSPQPDENEQSQGIFTNYMQFMDNVVGKWDTVRTGSPGIDRIRKIHDIILKVNKFKIIDPVYIKNHGTLAEYGLPEQQKKRMNYAFYEGYSRMDVDFDLWPDSSVTGKYSRTGIGVMFRISDNIELYEANLNDTFNMFGTPFLGGDSVSRRIIYTAKDSTLHKLKMDGLWAKGNNSSPGKNQYYIGASAIRLSLKLLPNAKPVDSAFSIVDENAGIGDPEGIIVGGVEKSILKMYEIQKGNGEVDTLKNSKYPENILHGQKRWIEADSNYLGKNTNVSFVMQGDESERKKIQIIPSGYGAILQDTSPSSGVKLSAFGKLMKGSQEILLWVYNRVLQMGHLCFKNAVDNELELVQMGEGAVSTPIAESFELMHFMDNDRVVLRRTKNIKIYRGDPNFGGELWFPRATNPMETEWDTIWKDFKKDFLNIENVYAKSGNSVFEKISIEVYENGASTPKKETLYLTSVFIKDIEFYKQPSNEEEIPVEKIPDFTWVLYNDMDVYFKIKFAKDTRVRSFGTVQVPTDDLIRAYYNNLNLRFEGGNGSAYPVELCPAMPLNSVISNPDIKNGDIILRLKSTEHILNHINKYIKEPDELKNTSKYSIDVYPGIFQYSTDMDEFDRKSGYQFGKSRQGKLKEGQENPFSEDAFEGTGEQIAVSPNTYKCDVEIPSFDYIYNGGMIYLTLGKDILYPNETLYRIAFPNTAQWVAFSGHGISGRHAGLFYMDSDKLSDHFMLVDFDGTKAKDEQYRNIFVVDLLKSAWAGKVKILILNSCYNLNLRVNDGVYPSYDQIWNDVSNIGKDNNALKWFEMLGNERNALQPNTAVLGWGRCVVDGVAYGNKSTGQSPADIVQNGSFTAPMMKEFVTNVNSMSSNSTIAIANLWIDAAIKANEDQNLLNNNKVNTNCFNAVAIACNETTIKAFAIEVKETTGKPKYELTKKETWNCVIP